MNENNLKTDIQDALTASKREAKEAIKDVYAMMWFVAAVGVLGLICVLALGVLR